MSASETVTSLFSEDATKMSDTKVMKSTEGPVNTVGGDREGGHTAMQSFYEVLFSFIVIWN